jgi:hypothetical protein
MADQNEMSDGQGSQPRGPNFPSINLEKALELAGTLYEKEKRAAVPVPVVLGHWGYKNPKSSTATMAIAALRSYGLLDYQGTGPNRAAKLSTRALKIILNTPERHQELKEAALSPKVHRQIWERYKEDGLPSDETLKHYLIFDLNFNDAAVEAFLARLRNTFSLANLNDGDKLSDKDKPDPARATPTVGDRVQWTSRGQMMFPEPLPVVTGLSEDGQYVFVEGTTTGLPVTEVTVMESTAKPGRGGEGGKAAPDVFSQAEAMFKGTQQPPAPPLAPVRPGVKQETFSFDAGEVVVRWPAKLTEDEFEDLKGQFEILLRKIGRSVKADAGGGGGQ